MPLTLRVAGKTDKGLVRSGNEDCLHIDESNHVYAVCDGMGGHQAGEVASLLASETIRCVFTDFPRQVADATELDIGRVLPTSTSLLLKAVRLANRGIFLTAAADANKAGMGTTVVATAFEADIVSVAHVGDSRAYRLGKDRLEPLTKDHSWVEELQEAQEITREEASTFVGKNVITRALGVRPNVEVDYRILKAMPGDIFMLCSDGLCGFADDDEIFDVADRFRGDIDKMAANLVQMANDRGGADNVTVVVIQVIEASESPLPELEVATLGEETEVQLKAEDEWVARIHSALEERRETDSQDPSESGGSKPLLIGIFVVFAIVALLIIYFTQFR